MPIGRGFSSPVVAEGRVYVSGAELREPEIHERLRCLDAATGQALWTFSAVVPYPDWIFMEGQGRGPGATPIVQGGRVYSLGGFGHVICLDAATGRVVWQKHLSKTYDFEQFPTDASPLIEGDLLVVSVSVEKGETLIALDKNTGRVIWRALNERSSHSSPVVIEAGGVRQLIAWTRESVSSLDPATGKLYWRERMKTSADYAVATPVVQGRRLLIGGLMMELDASRPRAKVLWPRSRAVTRRVLSNTSTPLIQGDHVYSARSDGELVCLDIQTGRQLWEVKGLTQSGSGASIHMTAHPGGSFLFTDQGELIRARLTPEGFRKIGQTPLIQPTWEFGARHAVWSSPAFANGRVFVRNDKEILCASLVESE
jgi:outer membrane protein assembly factor BamB